MKRRHLLALALALPTVSVVGPTLGACSAAAQQTHAGTSGRTRLGFDVAAWSARTSRTTRITVPTSAAMPIRIATRLANEPTDTVVLDVQVLATPAEARARFEARAATATTAGVVPFTTSLGDAAWVDRLDRPTLLGVLRGNVFVAVWAIDARDASADLVALAADVVAVVDAAPLATTAPVDVDGLRAATLALPQLAEGASAIVTRPADVLAFVVLPGLGDTRARRVPEGFLVTRGHGSVSVDAWGADRWARLVHFTTR